jgi:hypothetical protein
MEIEVLRVLRAWYWNSSPKIGIILATERQISDDEKVRNQVFRAGDLEYNARALLGGERCGTTFWWIRMRLSE